MRKSIRNALVRRERQIMDALYRLKSATVGQVLEALPGAGPPGTPGCQRKKGQLIMDLLNSPDAALGLPAACAQKPPSC